MITKVTLAILAGLYLAAIAFSGVANINYAKAQTNPAAYFISGTIRVASAPLSGIKVSLFRGEKRTVRISETKTDSNGNYGFTVDTPDYYVVKPGNGRYSFSPEYFRLFVSNSISALDFTATKN